jgi:DNA-binding transcriptional regulator YiaG
MNRIYKGRRHNVNAVWMAKRIKTLIRTMRVSQKEFAKVTGVGVRSVHHWLAREAVPRLKTLEMIEYLESQHNVVVEPFKGR